MRGLFVTGTDTDVGKTYVSSIILRELIDNGFRVGALKPACSGSVLVNGELRWPDLDQLAEAAGISDIDLICNQRFQAPLAPPVAARLEDRKTDLSAMQNSLLGWQTRADIVVVEGVGGLLCPLTAHQSVADFAVWVGFPLLIVARLGLGTINHTLLTIEAAKRRDIDIAGVVLNDGDSLADTPAGRTNFDELTNRTDVPVLGIVTHGGRSISLRDRETPARIAWSGLAGFRGDDGSNSE
ncbi:MAG: dethiobiotin synthase [Planctomycetaceae bacterium]|jgi:dethiobiotin synthetase|nr:dethiobiotin synthase [Planctomycetaceae bacterium]